MPRLVFEMPRSASRPGMASEKFLQNEIEQQRMPIIVAMSVRICQYLKRRCTSGVKLCMMKSSFRSAAVRRTDGRRRVNSSRPTRKAHAAETDSPGAAPSESGFTLCKDNYFLRFRQPERPQKDNFGFAFFAFRAEPRPWAHAPPQRAQRAKGTEWGGPSELFRDFA